MPTLTPLEEKVRAIVHEDDISGALRFASQEIPRPKEEHLTQFELDLRDWGVIYGIAWAIARSEDPLEPEDGVGYRALVAARRVWADWGGPWNPREAVVVADRPQVVA